MPKTISSLDFTSLKDSLKACQSPALKKSTKGTPEDKVTKAANNEAFEKKLSCAKPGASRANLPLPKQTPSDPKHVKAADDITQKLVALTTILSKISEDQTNSVSSLQDINQAMALANLDQNRKTINDGLKTLKKQEHDLDKAKKLQSWLGPLSKVIMVITTICAVVSIGGAIGGMVMGGIAAATEAGGAAGAAAAEAGVEMVNVGADAIADGALEGAEEGGLAAAQEGGGGANWFSAAKSWGSEFLENNKVAFKYFGLFAGGPMAATSALAQGFSAQGQADASDNLAGMIKHTGKDMASFKSSNALYQAMVKALKYQFSASQELVGNVTGVVETGAQISRTKMQISLTLSNAA